MLYANYKKWSVVFDPADHHLDVLLDGRGVIAEQVRVTGMSNRRGERFVLSDFAAPSLSRSGGEDAVTLTALYSGAKMGRLDFSLGFRLSDQGVQVNLGGGGDMQVELRGLLHWGDHDQTETMAVCLDGRGMDINCASGPACSGEDNALFDPETDAALLLETLGEVRLRYDWQRQRYGFRAVIPGKDYGRFMVFKQKKQVYERLYGMDYHPMNKQTLFKTPPVGWMTWYAVQFAASEKTVLDNARVQREKLKAYGANALWVDWEWYHTNHCGIGDAGVDMFHPDPKAYPNGLKKVADEIRRMGFVPGLWVGPTSDPTQNELLREEPQGVMCRRPMWCGQYFPDPTSPLFLEKILPRALGLAREWGYQAIKWDCLPDTIKLVDDCHFSLAQPLSTREVMARAFQKGRQALGEDAYLLYCCALSQRDMDLACTVFDAARIGGDIFAWDAFVQNCVDKVYRYYALHQVVLAADPDNVVIRSELNTLEQAVTRSALVSLLGMPFTLGDDLTRLEEERMEILRRSIPPIPGVRPKDVRVLSGDGQRMVVNLWVERPFGRWNVVDAVNLTYAEKNFTLDLHADLHLDRRESPYLAYDFWQQEYLGEFDQDIALTIPAYGSRILGVRPRENRPCVLSTSRHIAHGAFDLKTVAWDETTLTLSGVSSVVGGETYSLVLAAGVQPLCPRPEMNARALGAGVWRVSFDPTQTGDYAWRVLFDRQMEKE